MSEDDLPPLSDVQHEIMTVVWDRGKCSAADVWKVLEQRRGVSRNTVHTLLVRLEDKGWLTRTVADGGVLFSAAVSRSATQQQCVRRLIDTVFDGSAEGLVLALLNQGTVSAEESARIRELIKQAKGKKT
ncbi:MAG: BlaI/MecI/CopY family transcriptional regulator [Pirellulaceae bacterium]|nr:BlaI/MecI/CopY family transcriptional regulator [Pirellulaceae bacterium]